jgi:hypothetical protein
MLIFNSSELEFQPATVADTCGSSYSGGGSLEPRSLTPPISTPPPQKRKPPKKETKTLPALLFYNFSSS